MKVLIVYHSVYGHVLTMAKAVQEGARDVAGTDVAPRREAEFPDYVKYMKAEKGFETLLQVFAETREQYRDQVLAARKGSNGDDE